MRNLHELGISFKSYSGRHYALMNTEEAGNIKRKSFERNCNIQIIPQKATVEHHEIYEILSEISDQVAKKIVSYALVDTIQRGKHYCFLVKPTCLFSHLPFAIKLHQRRFIYT